MLDEELLASLGAWSRGARASMPDWYERVCVAREMSWTYDELMNCPQYFYNDIRRAMLTEAAHAKEMNDARR